MGEAAWATGDVTRPSRRGNAHALAPCFTVTNGWLAAAYRLAGRDDRADALPATMGPTARPLWGRVQYYLLTSELDAAADWYERLIEGRDPFALIYASDDYTTSLRVHPRWRRLSELLRLPPRDDRNISGVRRPGDGSRPPVRCRMRSIKGRHIGRSG
jgi:hypothetical protein